MENAKLLEKLKTSDETSDVTQVAFAQVWLKQAQIACNTPSRGII
ncbi:MAG: hypothetical protein ACXW11_09615 [Methylotenera sp.]